MMKNQNLSQEQMFLMNGGMDTIEELTMEEMFEFAGGYGGSTGGSTGGGSYGGGSGSGSGSYNPYGGPHF
jgi:hypothetical protein